MHKVIVNSNGIAVGKRALLL